MFTIRLASGLEVSVISIEMSGTYSGVLEGAPGKDLNNELLRDVLELDGEEGYYIKMPSEEQIASRLPKCKLEVHLESYFTAPDGSEFSLVRAIWFEDIDKNRTLKEILQTALQDLDWVKHCKGFYFI